MPERKTPQQLVREFMNQYFVTQLTAEEQKIVWLNLNDIVNEAQLRMIEDAESAISKLRVFNLGR